MSDHSDSSAQPASTSRGGSLTSAHRYDQGILLAGALALVGSLLPYYTVSVDMMGMSTSDSATAWHGFFGWFGVLAAVIGSGLLLAHLQGVDTKVPTRTAVLAAYAVAVLCTVVALFVFPGGGCDDLEVLGADVCDGIDFGRGFGYWLTLLAVLAGLALAVMRRGDSSEPTA